MASDTATLNDVFRSVKARFPASLSHDSWYILTVNTSTLCLPPTKIYPLIYLGPLDLSFDHLFQSGEFRPFIQLSYKPARILNVASTANTQPPTA